MNLVLNFLGSRKPGFRDSEKVGWGPWGMGITRWIDDGDGGAVKEGPVHCSALRCIFALFYF